VKLTANIPGDKFSETLLFADSEWVFDTRIVHHNDLRFEGTVRSTDEQPVDFTLIRLATKRWFISGDGVPEAVQNNAEVIGKAFERHCH